MGTPSTDGVRKMLLKSSKKPLQLRQTVIIVTLNPVRTPSALCLTTGMSTTFGKPQLRHLRGFSTV